jgi:hypothetical protein
LNGQGVAEKPGGAFSNNTVSEPLPITGRSPRSSPRVFIQPIVRANLVTFPKLIEILEDTSAKA